MRFDLIALDLDDTLLHSDLSISQANRRALKKAHGSGAKIVLASGRNIHSMGKYARLLGLDGPDDYLISTNGAEIVETATGRVLDETRIPAELCGEAVDFLEAAGSSWQIYVDGKILYGGRKNAWTDEDSRLTGLPNEEVGDVAAALANGQLKFVIPGDPAVLPSLRDKARAHFGNRLEIFISKPCFLEFLPSGVDKARALATLAGRLDIPLARTLVMGDAANDLGMVREAGFSCAPANAVPEVKATARWVSPLTNDEDFVADALERWMEFS